MGMPRTSSRTDTDGTTEHELLVTQDTVPELATQLATVDGVWRIRLLARDSVGNEGSPAARDIQWDHCLITGPLYVAQWPATFYAHPELRNFWWRNGVARSNVGLGAGQRMGDMDGSVAGQVMATGLFEVRNYTFYPAYVRVDANVTGTVTRTWRRASVVTEDARPGRCQGAHCSGPPAASTENPEVLSNVNLAPNTAAYRVENNAYVGGAARDNTRNAWIVPASPGGGQFGKIDVYLVTNDVGLNGPDADAVVGGYELFGTYEDEWGREFFDEEARVWFTTIWQEWRFLRSYVIDTRPEDDTVRLTTPYAGGSVVQVGALEKYGIEFDYTTIEGNQP
jgi:hypothetical protein